MHASQITGLLFETHGRSVVFACEPAGLCLKLIRSRSIFRAERLAHEQLSANAHALDLFLPLLFFCRVPHLKRMSMHAWRGYCMRQGQYSMRDILYKSPRHTDDEHRALLQRLLHDRDHYCPPQADTEPQGGLCVAFKPTQSVQMSLCLAVLRLLQALHQSGWVHGDSHLGNFVYANGRLYAIDFERSFCSTDPIQHLLDIQVALLAVYTVLVLFIHTRSAGGLWPPHLHHCAPRALARMGHEGHPGHLFPQVPPNPWPVAQTHR
jgi:hypothetical protein